MGVSAEDSENGVSGSVRELNEVRGEGASAGGVQEMSSICEISPDASVDVDEVGN